jgi:hypothetical protein
MALTDGLLLHAMLEGDLVLLISYLDFNTKAVDDEKGTGGNELGGVVKGGRSSGVAPTG